MVDVVLILGACRQLCSGAAQLLVGDGRPCASMPFAITFPPRLLCFGRQLSCDWYPKAVSSVTCQISPLWACLWRLGCLARLTTDIRGDTRNPETIGGASVPAWQQARRCCSSALRRRLISPRLRPDDTECYRTCTDNQEGFHDIRRCESGRVGGR